MAWTFMNAQVLKHQIKWSCLHINVFLAQAWNILAFARRDAIAKQMEALPHSCSAKPKTVLVVLLASLSSLFTFIKRASNNRRPSRWLRLYLSTRSWSFSYQIQVGWSWILQSPQHLQVQLLSAPANKTFIFLSRQEDEVDFEYWTKTPGMLRQQSDCSHASERLRSR